MQLYEVFCFPLLRAEAFFYLQTTMLERPGAGLADNPRLERLVPMSLSG